MIDFIIYIIEWLFSGFFKKSTPAIQVTNTINKPQTNSTVVLDKKLVEEPIKQLCETPNPALFKPVAKSVNPFSFFPPTNLSHHLNSLSHNPQSAFTPFQKK